MGGIFQKEIVNCKVIKSNKEEIVVHEDEEPRRFMPEHFPGLKPVYTKNGTVTVANSGKLADGAACLLLMSEELAKQRGVKA